MHALSTLEMQQTTSHERELVEVYIMPFSTVSTELSEISQPNHNTQLYSQQVQKLLRLLPFPKELLLCTRPTTMISRSDYPELEY